MKGVSWKSLIAGIVIVVGIVLIAFGFLQQAAGFDISKYEGIKPIKGTPGEIDYGDHIEDSGALRSFGKEIGEWKCIDITNPVQTGNIYEYSSPSCSVGTAAACGIGNIDFDDSKEGVVITDIYLSDSKCIFHAMKYYTQIKNFEETGKVACVFCYYEDISSKESGLLFNSPFQSIQCDSGQYLFSCLTRAAEGEEYRRDYLTSLSISPLSTSPTRCDATAIDFSANGQQRRMGITCSGTKYKWYISREDSEWGSCPGDMHLVSCSVTELTALEEIVRYVDDYGISVCRVKHSLSPAVENPKISTLCIENLWRWSHGGTNGWTESTEKNPAMYSPSCPAGTKPIACGTFTPEFEWWDGYGEDAINSIFIDGNRCKVVARDTEGGTEHKRSVGVLCANDVPDFKETGWSSWYTASSGIENGKAVTFTSPACDSGYSPIFCSIESDNSNEDYKEDGILSIVIKKNDNKCTITMGDDGDDPEMRVRFKTMCANSGVFYNYVDDKDYRPKTDSDPSKLNTPPCDFGVATMPITESNINEDAYKEDLLVNIMPTNDLKGFLIQAWDWQEDWWGGGGNEHQRRNGVVCLEHDALET